MIYIEIPENFVRHMKEKLKICIICNLNFTFFNYLSVASKLYKNFFEMLVNICYKSASLTYVGIYSCF